MIQHSCDELAHVIRNNFRIILGEILIENMEGKKLNQKNENHSPGLINKLKGDFLAGILIVVPLAAVFLILRWVFMAIDDILEPLVELIFGRPITGIGFLATVILIYLAGVFARNVLGIQLINYTESLMTRIPVARGMYTTFKQAMHNLMLPQTGAFKEVVLVEFPRPGMRTIGFITNRVTDDSDQNLVNVYIPTAPNPTSGFLEIMPESLVTHLDLSVEAAMKMVLSGGMVSPSVIKSAAAETAELP